MYLTSGSIAGFPAEPGNLEIDWNLSQKVRKPGQNKKFSRKPGYNLEC